MPENARRPHAHLPLYTPRWWAGEWQLCSSSCGPGGLSRRAVLCIRSVGLDEQRALEPPACEHLPQPPAETPCNRDVPCPATWAVGNWSEVSISTGGVSSAIGLGLQGGRDSVPGTPTAGHHGGRGTGTSQVWPHPQSLRGWDVLGRHSHGLQRPGRYPLTLSSWPGTLQGPGSSWPESLTQPSL